MGGAGAGTAASYWHGFSRALVSGQREYSTGMPGRRGFTAFFFGGGGGRLEKLRRGIGLGRRVRGQSLWPLARRERGKGWLRLRRRRMRSRSFGRRRRGRRSRRSRRGRR